MSAIDDACRELRAACEATGVDWVTLLVRADGRVEIRGECAVRTEVRADWTERADLVPGGAYDWPSAALAERLHKVSP